MQQIRTFQTHWPEARLRPGLTGLTLTFVLILLSAFL